MLLQGSGQGIVPAVLADTGAVGGLAGRRALIVVGAFGAHQGVVQAGQRIAHVVAGGESGHGQGPAAPAVLVHRDAQRTQLAADDALAAAEAEVNVSVVGVYKALGGWGQSPQPPSVAQLQ
ncbi:hypothetical protein G6F59_018257 [Rhizopus arrhizus]|nr:hypothetical protein G6F59_018257 [Rhizopus arrhizus]